MNIAEYTSISKDARKTKEIGLVRIGRNGIWLLNRKQLNMLYKKKIGIAELLKIQKEKREKRKKQREERYKK